LSAPNAQAGEKRGEIAAHKYEGLTIFQRASPRRRSDCGDPAAGSIIDAHLGIRRSGMSQKKRVKGTIFVRRRESQIGNREIRTDNG
jgi:hypothetical protein